MADPRRLAPVLGRARADLAAEPSVRDRCCEGSGLGEERDEEAAARRLEEAEGVDRRGVRPGRTDPEGAYGRGRQTGEEIGKHPAQARSRGQGETGGDHRVSRDVQEL